MLLLLLFLLLLPLLLSLLLLLLLLLHFGFGAGVLDFPLTASRLCFAFDIGAFFWGLLNFFEVRS